VRPAATEAVAGVTAMEVNTAAVTVKVADPLIVPEVAVMVALPCARLLANPVWSPTVATDVFDEAQLAVVLKFCVEPSL
jgi:hypothetical protein